MRAFVSALKKGFGVVLRIKRKKRSFSFRLSSLISCQTTNLSSFLFCQAVKKLFKLIPIFLFQLFSYKGIFEPPYFHNLFIAGALCFYNCLGNQIENIARDNVSWTCASTDCQILSLSIFFTPHFVPV